MIQSNSRIVLYGDSITDAGRARDAEPNQNLGNGYANAVASQLNSEFPQWNLEFWNRGISGNRVYDLEERLEADVLVLKPTLVSILIGINDTWRRYDSGLLSPVEEFQASLNRIVEKLQGNGAQVLLLEPFLLPVPEDRRAWREDLNPRIEAVRDVARQHSLRLVPLDGLFAAASAQRESAFWLPDGVHPSAPGHALIARHWVEAALED
jgi:lysophospholipase L1-like esterase